MKGVKGRAAAERHVEWGGADWFWDIRFPFAGIKVGAEKIERANHCSSSGSQFTLLQQSGHIEQRGQNIDLCRSHTPLPRQLQSVKTSQLYGDTRASSSWNIAK